MYEQGAVNKGTKEILEKKILPDATIRKSYLFQEVVRQRVRVALGLLNVLQIGNINQTTIECGFLFAGTTKIGLITYFPIIKPSVIPA